MHSFALANFLSYKPFAFIFCTVLESAFLLIFSATKSILLFTEVEVTQLLTDVLDVSIEVIGIFCVKGRPIYTARVLIFVKLLLLSELLVHMFAGQEAPGVRLNLDNLLLVSVLSEIEHSLAILRGVHLRRVNVLISTATRSLTHIF